MPRPRGRPTSGQDGPSDNEVLEAALEAFAEHGYEGTSVREIARDLGVSHNLIPQRYGSKEQLWYAAVNRAFGALLEDLLKVMDDPPPSDLERLRATIVRFVEANAARPALLRIIHQEAATPGPRLDHLYATYIDPVRRLGDRWLKDLDARGEIRTTSTVIVYFMMTHGAGGAVAFPALAGLFGEAVDPSDAEAVRRHAEATVDVLFGGLAAR